jgi:hypothetical protein
VFAINDLESDSERIAVKWRTSLHGRFVLGLRRMLAPFASLACWVLSIQPLLGRDNVASLFQAITYRPRRLSLSEPVFLDIELPFLPPIALACCIQA